MLARLVAGPRFVSRITQLAPPGMALTITWIGILGALGVAQTTARLSIDTSGAQGNNSSVFSAPSADGRFVAFESFGSNLVPNDLNAFADIFVRDRQSGTTERVSLGTGGVEADFNSFNPSISNDGRFVAFSSDATNLVAGDTNQMRDIFVRDRLLGTTERVNVGGGGAQASGGSSDYPSISADGRFVAFSSEATNLVAGDTNLVRDIFVRDRQLGVTERVSVDSSGAQGNNSSAFPAISADGRFVAFDSYASNLVVGDTNGFEDCFVRDRQGGTTGRVSVGTGGAQADANCGSSSISATGRFVAFASGASSLTAGDTNGYADIFVRDRVLGTTELVSVDSAEAQGNNNSDFPSISADGRFVAFESSSSNLVAGDTNGTPDIFSRDRQLGATERMSVDSAGTQANADSYAASISADGRYVTFWSSATNLVLGDSNAVPDIFVRDHPGCSPQWQTDIGGYAGMENAVSTLTTYDDGTGPALYAGGSFLTAGGIAASGMAMWDGTAWSPLGNGLAGGAARALAVYDDGSGAALFVGGTFTSAGGIPAVGIARWDGQSWSGLGPSLITAVSALAVYDHGTGPKLVVATDHALYEWDGTSMLPVPMGAVGWGVIGALAVHDDGTGPVLFVGGHDYVYELTARWDGASWAYYYGSQGFGVTALQVIDGGTGPRLYRGSADPFGGMLWGTVSEWNGSGWISLGSFGDGGVTSLCGFDDGSGPAVFVAGKFTFGTMGSVSRIARWDGSAWSGLSMGANNAILSLCAYDGGGGPALYAGGDFTTVDYAPANRIARWGMPSGCLPVGTVICEPGVNGAMQCPCLNPPSGLGLGCNNSSATGGAQLGAIGGARISHDVVVLTTSGEKPTATSIVLQGNSLAATGFGFGQGVRCVAGSLKRLYVKTAAGGSITAPEPGDTSIAARSAVLGDPIPPGAHRYYGVYYRDPIVLGGCPATSTFNITQQLDILWSP